MNAGLTQAYLDKMTAQLKEWGAKIEVVKAKVAKESASVRIDYHTKIDEWKKKEELFVKKIEEVRDAGVEEFEVVKQGAQHLWTNLSHFIENIGEHKKEIETEVETTVSTDKKH